MDSDGNTVVEQNCPEDNKLATDQACEDYSGCEDYSWDTGQWSVCSNTCGQGIQTRSVECVDSDGNIVTDDNCLLVKPDSINDCYDVSGCNSSRDDSRTVFDVIISLYNNPSGDDNPNNDTGFEEQTAHEEIIRYWADGIYEQSNGTHKLGQVKIFVSGQQSSIADVIWHQNSGRAGAFPSGYGIDGRNINFFGGYSLESAGYTLAHEWGHYVYGLYDEYRERKEDWSAFFHMPHQNDTPVKESIMHNQYNAEGGDYNWLNHSTQNNYQANTAQGRVYGKSGWETLIGRPEDDHRNAELVGFPSRIRYTALLGKEPSSGDNWMKRELPSRQNEARNRLEIIWMDEIPGLPVGRTYEATVVSIGGVIVNYPKPVVLTAGVSKGIPVTDINLITTIKYPEGESQIIDMNDEGKNGDAIAEDGIYSAILFYKANGAYEVSVEADNDARNGKFTMKSFLPAPNIDGDTPEEMWELSSVNEDFSCTASTRFTVRGATEDDHSNTAPGSLMNADNTNTPGVIDFSNDVDFFRIRNVDLNRNLAVRVTNTALGMEPVLTVYKSDSVTEIASASLADISEPNGYVHIVIHPSLLDTSGTMLASVRHSNSNSAQGTYDISAGRTILSDDESLLITDNNVDNVEDDDLSGGKDSDSNCFISTVTNSSLLEFFIRKFFLTR